MGSLITTGVSVTRPDLVKRMAVLNGVYKRTPQARHAVIQRAEELKTGRIDVETPLQRWFGESEVERIAAAKVKLGSKMSTCLVIPLRILRLHKAMKPMQMTGQRSLVLLWC